MNDTSHPNGASDSVLIVEDELELRDLLVEVLVFAGYSVQAAADGLSGLALASETRPAVAVVDIRMPGMNGVELAGHLRARQIPVVLMSAHQDQTPLDSVPFVPKPFTIEELLGAITQAIEPHS